MTLSRLCRNEIIGGIFPLPKTIVFPSSKNIISVANARCALHLITEHVNPNVIWMPDYHCPSMMESFSNREVKFYHVNNDLSIDHFHSGNNDLVVFIDYFGWPTSPRSKIKGRKLIDMSQALLSEPDTEADFLVYSPRKFLPMPDGGVLVSLHDDITCVLQEPPISWWGRAAEAMEQRTNDETNNEQWHERSREAKKFAPVGNYAMSCYSESILNSIDVTEIIARQRENFMTLFSQLRPYSIFKSLPAETVPIGFPVVCPNRDEVRRLMFNEDIYPPIHWELEHPLSKHIMTLPCDYRYTAQDMERVIKCFLKSIERSNKLFQTLIDIPLISI